MARRHATSGHDTALRSTTILDAKTVQNTSGHAGSGLAVTPQHDSPHLDDSPRHIISAHFMAPLDDKTKHIIPRHFSTPQQINP